MLVSNNEFRPRPAAVPKRGPTPWQRELRQLESNRAKAVERALAAEQRKAEALAKFAALTKEAGRDLRAMKDLATAARIDARWAKQLADRAHRACVELVRLIDQDVDDFLPPLADAIVKQAIERMLAERARVQLED